MIIHVLSTQTFLIPLYISFYYERYVLLYTYLMMYLGSTIYHLNDNSKILRTLDLTTSRSGGLIVFTYHVIHARNKCYPVILLHNIIALYLISRILHYYCNHLWIHIQVYFHLLTSFTLSCVVIDCSEMVVSLLD